MPVHLQFEEESNVSGNDAFAHALLDPDADIPAGTIGPDGNPAPKRFSVYRNNVVLSLIEAMTETYPSVKNIIGEKNFTTVVRIFISTHPPSSPMMQAYGGLFSTFLQEFKPLQHALFLADVARVEKGWIDAYHTSDKPPLDGSHLDALKPDELTKTRFKAHPAAVVVSSQYPLHDLFAARYDAEIVESNYVPSHSLQGVLITRPHLNVEINPLDHARAEFFKAILSEHTLAESIEKSVRIEQHFDISSAIALLLTSGATTGIWIS